MVDKNVGSIALDIFNSIAPMQDNISGLLVTIVENQQFFIEQFTGDSVGDPISDKFKPGLTNLATSNVLKLMASQDMGVQTVKVGELETDNKNLTQVARQFQERGMFELKSLSKGIKVFKARG